ncbi:uncharacterized protein LOC135831927 [Planococcus citri]|uniref:uncharacterized protein LOC135831927 n=1 Tax=Planococcus citri TaxID=170843 RepID=UPI0031F75727
MENKKLTIVKVYRATEEDWRNPNIYIDTDPSDTSSNESEDESTNKFCSPLNACKEVSRVENSMKRDEKQFPVGDVAEIIEPETLSAKNSDSFHGFTNVPELRNSSCNSNGYSRRMRSFYNRDRQHNSHSQKEYPKQYRKEQKTYSMSNDVKQQIADLENRLHALESKYQDLHNSTAANLDEMKKSLNLVDEKLASDTSNKFSYLQHMDSSELEKVGSVIDEMKIAIDYYRELKKHAQQIDKKRESNASHSAKCTFEHIPPHSDFILDEGNRAIVYVKSKIFKVGKNPKAAFGIWWSVGHKGNTSRVIDDISVATDEDDVNLHAFICVMETAIRFKVQRLCVITDTKYIINRMIGAKSQKDNNGSQWKILSTHPTDLQNLFYYACDMTTWFYDIKWSYVDQPSKLPGMVDALELINNPQCN